MWQDCHARPRVCVRTSHHLVQVFSFAKQEDDETRRLPFLCSFPEALDPAARADTHARTHTVQRAAATSQNGRPEWTSSLTSSCCWLYIYSICRHPDAEFSPNRKQSLTVCLVFPPPLPRRQKQVSLAEEWGCSDEGFGHFLQAMLCRLCVVFVSSRRGRGRRWCK